MFIGDARLTIVTIYFQVSIDEKNMTQGLLFHGSLKDPMRKAVHKSLVQKLLQGMAGRKIYLKATFFGGQKIRVLWSAVSQSAYVLGSDGRQLPSVSIYWFAWFRFHPHTQMYRASHQ